MRVLISEHGDVHPLWIPTGQGFRRAAIIFAGLLCMGLIIFAGGASMDNIVVMVLGNVVFG